MPDFDVSVGSSTVAVGGHFRTTMAIGVSTPTAPAGDASPLPRVEVLSPPAGSTIGPLTVLEVGVQFEPGSGLQLTAAFAGVPGAELVFDGGEFGARYSGSSLVQHDAGDVTFYIARDGGWPASPALTAYVLSP